jgi:hypothetical protein
MAAAAGLTPYELEREARVARNKEIMQVCTVSPSPPMPALSDSAAWPREGRVAHPPHVVAGCRDARSTGLHGRAVHKRQLSMAGRPCLLRVPHTPHGAPRTRARRRETVFTCHGTRGKAPAGSAHAALSGSSVLDLSGPLTP